MVSGESQVILNGATATVSFVAQGQLRGLAVSGDKRVDGIKELAELQGARRMPVDVGSWQGLLATAGTPAAVRRASTPRSRRFSPCRTSPSGSSSLGGEVKAGPPAELAKWIDTNTASYAAIIKEAGIKVQ